eukprot:6465922-Amphidinium_carterae.2
MELDTGKSSVVILRELDLSPFFVPVRASVENVTQVFWFFLAPDTSFSNSEEALRVRTSCNTPPRAALTALRVRSSLSRASFRIPFDLEISFIPVKVLAVTLPTSRLVHPSYPVRQGFEVPDGASASAFPKRVFPHALLKGPSQSAGYKLSLPGTYGVQVRRYLRVSGRSTIGH